MRRLFSSPRQKRFCLFQNRIRQSDDPEQRAAFRYRKHLHAMPVFTPEVAHNVVYVSCRLLLVRYLSKDCTITIRPDPASARRERNPSGGFYFSGNDPKRDRTLYHHTFSFFVSSSTEEQVTTIICLFWSIVSIVDIVGYCVFDDSVVKSNPILTEYVWRVFVRFRRLPKTNRIRTEPNQTVWVWNEPNAWY